MKTGWEAAPDFHVVECCGTCQYHHQRGGDPFPLWCSEYMCWTMRIGKCNGWKEAEE